MHSVRVQHQYTGTAGCIANGQVVACLIYAAPCGHTLIDPALTSMDRRSQSLQQCRNPRQKRGFVTRPTAGSSLGCLRCADQGARSLSGRRRSLWSRPKLRPTVRGHGLGYVLAMVANRRVPSAAGPICVDRLSSRLPTWAWQKHSAGTGQSRAPALLLLLNLERAVTWKTTLTLGDVMG